MEHENSARENSPIFLDFPLFLGIFHWEEPTKRVPFTAEPGIPKILTKWKAPYFSKKSLRENSLYHHLQRTKHYVILGSTWNNILCFKILKSLKRSCVMKFSVAH